MSAEFRGVVYPWAILGMGEQESNPIEVAYRRNCGVLVRTVAMDAAEKVIKTKTRLWDYVGETKGRAIIKANVDLIRTVEPKKFPLIVRALVKCFKEKMSREEAVAEVEKVGQVDTTRAEIIVDDQIAKAAMAFQLLKWKSEGWKRVMWRHSHGVKEPRKLHTDWWDGKSGKRNGKPNGLNGFIFDIDNPPVIDKETGERGYPAQLIGCRCFLVPYDK